MVFCNVEAITETEKAQRGHNPYFNRWFSAIRNNNSFDGMPIKSQSLF